ncbi:hypothetical protein TWF730_010856 [Orbilia blumenaviensis]|uniref:Heme haloperoxidase family profile domain-containing protein n=1 Tax=Orbilia blumenaviensis TaxID=1796055 RepID=A0AAV9UKY6_9PEZI
MENIETPTPLKRGEWKRPEPTDLRGPCPVINSLANHGYIARDGRNITADELLKAFQEELGLGIDVSLGLIKPPFTIHTQEAGAEGSEGGKEAPQGYFHGFLSKLPKIPTPTSESNVGLRNPGQVNEKGEPVLNLDQLRRHGAIEHDVSLVRRDFAQGDNTTTDPDLLRDLLASASDDGKGGKIFTIQDFARFRNQRLEQQKRDNPKLNFGLREAVLAFGEVALFMSVWGAKSISEYDRLPYEYAKAVFGEERLPYQEGWTKRNVPLTLPELIANSTYLQASALYDYTIGRFWNR